MSLQVCSPLPSVPSHILSHLCVAVFCCFLFCTPLPTANFKHHREELPGGSASSSSSSSSSASSASAAASASASSASASADHKQSSSSEFVDLEVGESAAGSGGGVSDLESLGLENTLWANTVIASGTVIGCVVFTGAESRAVMNQNAPNTKVGLLDGELNTLSKVCIWSEWWLAEWAKSKITQILLGFFFFFFLINRIRFCLSSLWCWRE
jgi:hypothetical protein